VKEQQKAMTKRSLWHINCNFFELAAIWHHPLEQVLNYVKTEAVDEQFYQSQKPKIIIAPHHGSWEMLNLWLSGQGPLYSLYKPARSPSLNQYVLQKRSRNGAFLAPSTTAGLRHLLKGLKKNGTVMILPDQRPARNTAQIEATFFGYPAATSLLIKKLLDKVECDVFLASMQRNLDQPGYHLKLKELDSKQLRTSDLVSANYMNASIEALVRDDIAQYQWAYRRFPIRYYHALEHDRRHLDESKFN
jgi:KDO2-lipid IV(A) lauroyltransferase